MKLKKYIKELQDKIKKDPTILELDLILNSNNIGNGFYHLYSSSCVGILNTDKNHFVPKNHDDYDEYKNDSGYKPAICIN